MSADSHTFPRAFLFHHRAGTLAGLQLPSGRVLLAEDVDYGFATVAPTTEDLLKGYPGARIEWPGAC
ncbi:hypothetical protein [Streptomyces niveus]|uniref:hypothetical protein n=1 Tax=Streptomyces niveus TaxID=193462 RepID=UPI00367CEDD2